MSKVKGLLITFEGGEGSGKTTLIEKLYQTLTAKECSTFKTRAPGGTKVGEIIRSLVLEAEEPLSPKTELLLFLADRAEHVEKVIAPAIEEGKLVLCDRYNDSTLAYQGAARGFSCDVVENLCLFATGGLIPDLTFYLDLDPEKGQHRRMERDQKQKVDKKGDKIEREALAFHARVRSAFLEIAEKDPERVCVLDASKSKEEVFEKALHQISLMRSACR